MRRRPVRSLLDLKAKFLFSQKRETMSDMRLKIGDPAKVVDDWSKRGKIVDVDEINGDYIVVFDGERNGTRLKFSRLVHLSYTWEGNWIPQ